MINYSFIIPHHNSPELLNRCLASIPEREDIQIVVVDDNSKEDKKPCINRQGVEVIYIDALHTKGAGRARNVGMAKATGKWLLFADCDDYYEEGFIDILDEYKDKNIDVLYFNYNVIDGSDKSLKPDNYVQEAINACNGNDHQALLLVQYKNNAPWNKMVKRTLVAKHNMYFEEVINSNDAMFAIWVASCTEQVAVNRKKLYNYILNTNGLTYKRQSIKDVLCRIDYYIKYNAYTRHLGHPELKLTLMKYVLGTIKHDVTLCPILPVTICKIFFDRQLSNRWINILIKR